MSLTKDDLKKIKAVVDASADLVFSKIDSLESYMLKRFDKVDKRLDQMDKKIDQLIKTEDEDIRVAFKEIQALKFRLAKLESKLGFS